MNPVIENYEIISSLTAQMRAAAMRGAWDRLAQLEQQCKQRVATMQALDMDAPLNEHTRLRKMDLIRKILADDAEIRNHIDPWMAQVQHDVQRIGRPHHLQEAHSI